MVKQIAVMNEGNPYLITCEASTTFITSIQGVNTSSTLVWTFKNPVRFYGMSSVRHFFCMK